MAGQARYTAVLDACVLYSIAITDALLSLATAGLFAAKWTIRIEQEWMRALETTRPELVGRLGVRRDCMRAAVPDWEVPSAQWQCVKVPVCLPDPDDLHVLAAAIAGHADCIVTDNLRDFPADILRAYELEAIYPDTFIINQWDLDPVAVIAAVGELPRALAVVDGLDVAADLVLAVADDAAIALLGQLDDDLDRAAGGVPDGELAAGVEVELIGHGRRPSGEEAWIEDPDLEVDLACGPGVAREVDAAGDEVGAGRGPDRKRCRPSSGHVTGPNLAFDIPHLLDSRTP